MRVIHSAKTRAPEAGQAIDGIAGAILHEADDDNRYSFWEIVPAKDVDRLYNEEHDDLITANHEDDIERELVKRYPCEQYDATYILRRGEYEWCTGRDQPRFSRRVYRQTTQLDGWVVLKQPLLNSPASLDELIEMTDRVGPVLVDSGKLHRLAQEHAEVHKGRLQTLEIHRTDQLLEHLGFVQQPRSLDGQGGLTQINHSPKTIERRKYDQKRREVQKRQQGHFPLEVVHDLGHYVNINRWRNNPYSDVFHIGGPCSWEYRGRGWGGSRKVEKADFQIDFILNTLDFVKKLGGKQALGYWRDASEYRYCSSIYSCCSFTEAVEAALPYLHSAEAQAQAILEQLRQDTPAEARHRHRVLLDRFLRDTELDGGVTNPEDWFISEDEFVRDYLANDYAMQSWQRQLRFCRWLRQEARGCGVKIPPKPRMPDPPSKKHKAKRRRQRSNR